MRIRSHGKIVTTPRELLVRTASCVDGNDFYHSADVPDCYIEGEFQSMIDDVVPGFRLRKARGEVFFNNMSSTKVTVTSQASDFWVQALSANCIPPTSPVARFANLKIVGGFPLQNVPAGADPVTKLPFEASALAQAEIARARVLVSTDVLSKRGRSDSDLWESVAEYRQTLSLLENPLTKLRSLSLKLLKSVERESTSRALVKEISQGYLIYRYGILPAMKDVENILKSLTKLTGKQRKTVRSSERLYATKGTTGVIEHAPYINSNWSLKTIDSMTVRAMSLDEVDMSFLNNLGFSTKSLITLPWELMSYSFVADWALNIGDFIGSTAPSIGFNQLGSCLVEQRVVSQEYTFTGSVLSPPSVQLMSPYQGSVGVIRVSKSRGPLALPAVSIRNDFGFSNFTRPADAFALLASRFTKISKFVGPQPNLSAFRNKSAYRRWSESTN